MALASNPEQSTTKIKTYMQWRRMRKDEFLRDYPQDREYLQDWLAMNATISHYEQYCASLINAGIQPALPVADSWSPETLYNLKKHYVTRGMLDWYAPAPIRTNKQKYEH